jgi:hypothetical protein
VLELAEHAFLAEPWVVGLVKFEGDPRQVRAPRYDGIEQRPHLGSNRPGVRIEVRAVQFVAAGNVDLADLV